MARGSPEYLRKNLAEAVTGLRDDSIRGESLQSNRKAAAALSDYAGWLERQRLPKSTAEFALGTGKFRRFLAETELVDLAPEKILELGMAQLKKEQDACAEAAKTINSGKSPVDVFKEIKSEHPTAENLLPDIAKDLDQSRKFVTTGKFVTIPSEGRARVKETRQYCRANSFA